MKNEKKASQGAPASQGEINRSWRLGGLMRAYGAERRNKSHRAVVAPVLLVVPLVLCVLGYVRSRPNTAGVALNGPFDAERAFADLKALVSFGPRPSGSPALERSREFLLTELRAAGVRAIEDKFTATTPIGQIPMCNIVAKIPGASPSTVVIGGHYDTKRMATPFVGANDGGSSAAFLLEMTRVLARRQNRLTYRVVFFDGEEAVQDWSTTDSLYGSRHFAAQLAAQGNQRQVRAVIVVDMIADAHLDIRRETYSTPWLTGLIFGKAHRLGYGRYFLDRPTSIEDDQVPFLELGIPALDIIDLDYGPLNLLWHTRFDTVDKCSRGSLSAVGDVVLQSLGELEERSVALVANPSSQIVCGWCQRMGDR